MCMWKLPLRPKMLLTVQIVFPCAAPTHPQQQIRVRILRRDTVGDLQTPRYSKASSYIMVIRTKRTFHYSRTVPPGGQTVLFPSVTECCSYYLRLSVFAVIIWRFPQEAIYLFIHLFCEAVRLCIGKAIINSEQNSFCSEERKARKELGSGVSVYYYEWSKRMALLIRVFCCIEEMVYKLGLYHGLFHLLFQM